MPQHHLFLFTISPVQSFIAQARKTQDLYAGSLILSELTKAAAQEAQTKGLELVFPQKIHEGNSFPNRFIGTLEGNFTNQELQTKGQSIEDKVIETFNGFANNALNKVDLTAPQSFWEQIEAHLDINWLFLPIETSYKAAYEQIEPYMASLKNLRLINNHNPEQGRKCSLDGERNALFCAQGSTNRQLRNQAIEIDPLTTKVWLNDNEGLSAVSLIKRAWSKEFPSTAAVALSQQLKKLSAENKELKELKELLDCYKDLFSNNYAQACIRLQRHFRSITITGTPRTNFDEQLLFEENLTPKNIPNATQLSIAKEIQQKLKSHLTQNHYALIAFDGDKMGALLSGEYLKDKTTDLAEFQGELSSLLMKFSQWIYNNLDKKQVDVIYAGGDDFLGFVNLHHLFEVVKTLRIKFEEQVNQELQKKYPLEKDFTFSMGIVIAHYKTPLSIVLQTARNMEKLAKRKEGGNRNAFAIAALKHSGENHQAYFNWDLDLDDPDKCLPTWNALEKRLLRNLCAQLRPRTVFAAKWGR
jgi:CRISPR-associated protein Cmr2